MFHARVLVPRGVACLTEEIEFNFFSCVLLAKYILLDELQHLRPLHSALFCLALFSCLLAIFFPTFLN